MAYDEELAERTRNSLSDIGNVREEPMMGALSFMVDGHMCCGVSGRALMVRIGRDAYEATLKEDHVGPMEMSGRKPSGFVIVDPAGIQTDEALARWIARGRSFIATLPPKAPN